MNKISEFEYLHRTEHKYSVGVIVSEYWLRYINFQLAIYFLAFLNKQKKSQAAPIFASALSSANEKCRELKMQ